MIAFCLQAGRTKVLAVAACFVVVTLLADHAVGNTVSLGVLYIFPVVLGAVVLGPAEIAIFAVVCSLLRAWFDTPGLRFEVVLRFIFAFLGYFASGLFVTALVRNRELVVGHLQTVEEEQRLRQSAEEQLKLLVESSPAAILTIDGAGVVLAANAAANAMFGPESSGLRGRNISSYLPILADAVRFQIGPEAFRTAAQSQGQRENGDIFLAHSWFSSYLTPEGMRLAAIVVDSSEEMRAREEQNLQQLAEYNRIGAAALSHEVRNVCAAINLLSVNLRNKHQLTRDADYLGLTHLIGGLEKVAALDLHSRVNGVAKQTSLQSVLDNLRIIVEPEWREMGGVIRWPAGPLRVKVCADPHGLLQVLLNLAQNSYRAVKDCGARELVVSACAEGGLVAIRLRDSGPGINAPEHLFEPFRRGAQGSGLGLYISRAVVRSYGGDLKFEPAGVGACFTVALQVV